MSMAPWWENWLGGRKYSKKEENLVPVPQYPNITFNGLAGDRTLTSTEALRRLTA